MTHRFILDNGAYIAKSGFSVDKSPRNTPNYITKSKNGRETFVGVEVNDCKDYSALFYNLAFHKGILVNWDTQRQVWNQMFKRHCVDFSSTHLILTEPVFNFGSVQECLDELVFEEFGFDGLIRINAPTLAAYRHMKENATDFCLVVDSGYSFTHVIPFYKGKIILEGLLRINLGGKHITNYLKEIISYRQLMVMDETFVVNQIKEEVCFVSTDFYGDMDIAKKKGKENTIARDYVLPDYSTIRKGYAKSQEESTGRPSNNEQIIRLNNERFTAPELLFNPSDIGIQEMGIAEAIVHSVQSCHIDTQSMFYANVLLIGGSTLFKGFKERIYKDVRSLIPDDYELNVNQSDDPINDGWRGGKHLASSLDYNDLLVTKKMYDEEGHGITREKFELYQG